MAQLTAIRSGGVATGRPAGPRALPSLARMAPALQLQQHQISQPRPAARPAAGRRPAAAAGAGAAADTAAATEAATVGKVLKEVTQEDYYTVIRDAGNKLVVVDCYTDWCGPCKMILPTLQQWAEELEDKVEIVKFNCNKNNKELGIALGIKVAPTFLLYKDGRQVDKMTGAKAEQLREMIEKYI